MPATLKQRLTGAAVLLVGAAILWPVVFDDPYSRQVNTQSEIPPEPPFERFAVEEATPIHDNLPLETGEHAPVVDSPLDGIAPLELAEPGAVPESVPATEPPKPVAAKPATVKPAATKPAATKPVAVAKPVVQEKPSTGMGTDAKGLPERWSVQMASFRDEGSALAMKNKLVAKGYPAYVKPVQASSGRFVRVYVGPKLDRAAAETLQKKLNAEFKVKSIVVRFDP
ncbi:MAG: hypothetical protein EP312_03685 [Gammaproteobacteria bacterium]|nr:MAG: hypothetical protein EP312_03685 [Gammaproteobacteria bacterium]